MLITVLVLMFIFSKIFSFIFFGQIWFKDLKFFILLYAYFGFDVYVFKGFVIHIIFGKFRKFQNIMDKFHSILYSPHWRKLHRISVLNLSKYREQQVLGWNFPQKFINGKFFEKLHIKVVISIYNSNVSLYQISVNMENSRFCQSLPKIIWMTKFWKTK